MIRKNINKTGISRWSEKRSRNNSIELPLNSSHSLGSNSQPLLASSFHDTNGIDSDVRITNRKSYRKLEGHSGTILTMAIWKSDTKCLLVTGSGDHSVKIWDLDKAEVIHTLNGHADWVRCVATSQDGEDHPILVSASADKTLIVWELLRGELVHHLRGHKLIVCSVAVSKDHTYPVIISASWDKTLKIWDIDSGDLLRTLDGHNAAVCCVIISGGLLPVIVSGDEEDCMKVWDLASGTLIQSIDNAHGSRISTIAISLDAPNPILVSGAANSAILVWDLITLSLNFTLQDAVHEAEVTGGHSNEVMSVAISEGQYSIILSACWDLTIKVWDSKIGALLRILEGHTKTIYSVVLGSDSFSPLIVSTGADQTISIWSVEDDIIEGVESLGDIDKVDLEDSLVLVGKFLTYWKFVLKGDMKTRPYVLSMKKSCLIFYCMLRAGRLNPKLIRTNVSALTAVLSHALEVVDLLRFDIYLNGTPMQFLLENRLCIGRAQDWIRIEGNMRRVIHFLSDSFQSTETLDSILSAVIGEDESLQWKSLLVSSAFNDIFKNLILNSPRSHSKIVTFLLLQGLKVENEPYPSPLEVPETSPYTVARWNEVEQGSGIYCYRIRVNNALPMEFLLSAEFTAAIAKSPELQSFVSVPLIEYVIQYKWESWGFWATLVNGISFCIYLLTTTASMLWICTNNTVYSESSMERTPLFIVCVAFSLFFNTLMMAMAGWQMSMSNKFEYFINFWNLSDILMIILCHLALILGTAFGPTQVNRTLCTLLSLVLWSRTLYFGRGSSGLSSLIDAIKHILYDMRYFILILSLFLSAFAVAFRVLGVFDSLFFSFILCFNMMLGDVSFYYVRGHVVPQLLYVTFLVSVAIILLNSLIALMEDSFQKARNRTRIAALVSRITLLKELEFKMVPLTRFISYFRKLFSNYEESGDLVVLIPESLGKPDLAPEVTVKQLLQRMNETFRTTQSELSDSNKKTVSEFNDQLVSRIDALEQKVVGLDDKLDKILTILTAASSVGVQEGLSSNLGGSIISSGGSGSDVNSTKTSADGTSSNSNSSTTASISNNMTLNPIDIKYTYFGAEEDDDKNEPNGGVDSRNY